MSNIRLDLSSPVYDGQTLTFKSPADCSQVTGLIIYYPENDSIVSRTFQFADAHGNNVESVSLFAENVLVKVILHTELNRAYVQNADTNAYLESQLKSKAPKGYGVGEHSISNALVSDTNSVTLSGLYSIDITTANGIGKDATLMVIGYSEDTALQIAVPKYGRPLYRHLNTDTQPSEWAPLSVLTNAAPEGYGLGNESINTVLFNDCNKATLNGWYWFNKGSLNLPYPSSPSTTIRVDNIDGFTLVQTAYFKDDSQDNVLTMQRVCSKGTWKEWEWIDPPMIPGVEYRTTQRYNGKTVYVKTVNLGALPVSGEKTVEHDCQYTSIVSFEVVAESTLSTAIQQFPFISSSGTIVARAHITRLGVYVTAFSDASQYNAHAMIKYIKD